MIMCSDIVAESTVGITFPNNLYCGLRAENCTYICTTTLNSADSQYDNDKT